MGGRPGKRPGVTRKDILGGVLSAIVAGVVLVATRSVTWGLVAFLAAIILTRVLMLGTRAK